MFAHGTADFVTEVKVTKRLEWGGCQINLVDLGQSEHYPIVFVHRTSWDKWAGPQPRFIERSKGSDFVKLVQEKGQPIVATMRFVGSAEAPKDAESQWLTHGPSSLLGKS